MKRISLFIILLLCIVNSVTNGQDNVVISKKNVTQQNLPQQKSKTIYNSQITTVNNPNGTTNYPSWTSWSTKRSPTQNIVTRLRVPQDIVDGGKMRFQLQVEFLSTYNDVEYINIEIIEDDPINTILYEERVDVAIGTSLSGIEYDNTTFTTEVPTELDGTEEIFAKVKIQFRTLVWTTIETDDPELYSTIYTDDGFEENNSISEAYRIGDVATPGIVLSAILADANDYYQINVSSPYTNLNIYLNEFFHEAGDFDIYLYDNNGTRIAQSVSTTDEELIEKEVSPGNYYIRVLALDGGRGFYDMSLSAEQPQNITITSPTTSSNWQMGTIHNITWQDNISENVKIELYKGASSLGSISSSTQSDGSFSWTVDDFLTAGNDYRIKITSTNNSSVSDFSEYFTISNSPSIVVTSPASTSDWQMGTTHNITWQDNISENVKIHLFKDTTPLTFILSITQSTPSTGIYSWEIPSNIESAQNYIISISITNDNTVSDNSEPFTISNSSSIVVTSPTSTSDWQIETTHNITWQDNISENVKILLFEGTSPKEVISASTLSDGTFSWTINSGLTSRSDYKIKIASVNDDAISDYSEYFTIIQPSETTQSIALNQGWNLISLNVHPSDTSPESVFQPIKSSFEQVKGLTKSYDPSVPTYLNTLSELIDGFAYWVKVKTNTSLDVEGTPIDCSNTNIPIIVGWNLIGYICQQQNDLESALSGIMNNIIQVKDLTKSYDPTVPSYLNTLTTMIPNNGYWIKSNATTNLLYPAPTNIPKLASDNEKENSSISWSPTIYANSMVFYGKMDLDNLKINEDDIVGAFVNNECRGIGYIIEHENEKYITIVINGIEKENVKLKAYNKNNNKIYEIKSEFNYVPGKIVNEIHTITDSNEQTDGFANTPVSTNLFPSYPNPFNATTNVVFSIHKHTQVIINIYTINGELVRELENNTFNKGTYTIAWNGQNDYGKVCNSGIYLIRLTVVFTSHQLTSYS